MFFRNKTVVCFVLSLVLFDAKQSLLWLFMLLKHIYLLQLHVWILGFQMFFFNLLSTQHFFLDYGLLFLNDNGLTKIRVFLLVKPWGDLVKWICSGLSERNQGLSISKGHMVGACPWTMFSWSPDVDARIREICLQLRWQQYM